MILILVVTILTTLLLVLSNVITLLPSAVLVLACVISLAIIVWRWLQRRHLLAVRLRQCQADWGSNIQHLGGLPLPLETQGILLLTDKELLFESDHLTQSIDLNSLISVLLLSAEQLRSLPDASICAIMGSNRCKSMVNAREHVRRSIGSLKKSTILLLHYHEGWQSDQNMSMIILALEQKPAQTKALLENKYIRQILRKYRPAKLKKTARDESIQKQTSAKRTDS